MSTELSPEQTTGNSPPASPIVGAPGRRLGRIDYCGITDEAAADLTGQLAAARELGWQAIELRSVDGQPLDLLSGPAFARAAARIAEAGLRVPVVASRIGGWARPVSCDLDQELNELALLADRCAALGTRFLRIMSYPNDGLSRADWEREVLRRVRVLTRSAERHGVVLLHENCSGWAAGTPTGHCACWTRPGATPSGCSSTPATARPTATARWSCCARWHRMCATSR